MAVKGFLNRLKFWKRTVNDAESSPEHRLASRLKRYEKYVYQLQSIIMWEYPALSFLCVVAVNIMFWFSDYLLEVLEWRCYGMLSFILLAMTVHDAWTAHVWPEISVAGAAEPVPDTPAHPSIMAISKLLTSSCASVKGYFAWLRNLRLQQPGLFCCLCSLVCSFLLLLGSSVSGLLLVYALLMSALIGPGLVVRCLPPHLKQTVFQYTTCVHQVFVKYSNEASDDEYMPVTTSEDIALLTRVSDFHNDTYDSITNPESSSDMVSGLAVMPSHEEDSLGTLSDLEPGISLLPLDLADDSDSNPDDHQIQFQSGHFNGDSSSDEEAFARDLEFSEADERDAVSHRGLSSFITQAVASNVLGSVSLLANVMRAQRTAAADDGIRQRTNRRQAEPDSDLDDFEIIDSEDVNNHGPSSS